MNNAAMQRLRQLVGQEKLLSEVAQALYRFARGMDAAAVGAIHITCADETEYECVDALQHGFVRYLLPPLKSARQSAFRLANVGGRYEWGALSLAENHFAAPPTADHFKLMLVKINSHVALDDTTTGEQSAIPGAARKRSSEFGTLIRYGRESSCCSALTSVLQGSHDPFVNDLRETLNSEGHDRVAKLLDTQQVDPTYRMLFAAITSVRLQAPKILLDAQEHNAVTPTYYLIVPCVTINRAGPDTEIVCGLYTMDDRADGSDAGYFGLGDDPGKYKVRFLHRRLDVTDELVDIERPGRDHRAMVSAAWRERSGGEPTRVQDERLEKIREDVTNEKHRKPHHGRALLRAALPILAEVAPIPAAILMFADGAVGIHHAFRVHKLADEMTDSAEARKILDEIHNKIDTMELDRAEALIEMLMNEFRD